MIPTRSSSVYRALVRLYPRAFRDEYGPDLMQHFHDLVADRGVRAASVRAAIDLLVTVPRARLETFMPAHQSASALRAAIVLLAAAGVVSILTGLLPGAILLVVAVVLAVGQRSMLAQAIRTPDGVDRRNRRFRIAAVLAIVALASIVSFATDTRDEEISGLSLMLHNLVGGPAMIGAVVFLVVGVATPRTGPGPWLPAGATVLATAVAIPHIDGGELSPTWWWVMVVLGLVGLGFLVAGVLAAFTSRYPVGVSQS